LHCLNPAFASRRILDALALEFGAKRRRYSARQRRPPQAPSRSQNLTPFVRVGHSALFGNHASARLPFSAPLFATYGGEQPETFKNSVGGAPAAWRFPTWLPRNQAASLLVTQGILPALGVQDNPRTADGFSANRRSTGSSKTLILTHGYWHAPVWRRSEQSSGRRETQQSIQAPRA